MDFQEAEIKEKQNSKLKTFISSFVADALVFAAVLLTIIITFIIIYMVGGQSKLKTLVANTALQRIKAMKALNPNVQHTHCDFGMLKFI